MRETENEINLLLPGGGDIFTPAYAASPWTLRPREDDGEGVDIPQGDEMGVSTLDEKGGK